MKPESLTGVPHWIRPNLFIKIVGIYLLLSKAIVVLLAIQIYQIWHAGNINSGLNPVYLIPMIAILLLWSVLSIVGSVKLFLLQKNGFYISFAAIIMTLLVFPSSFTLYLNFANNFSPELINTNTNYAISSIVIACDVTMIPLLLVSKNRASWKS